MSEERQRHPGQEVWSTGKRTGVRIIKFAFGTLLNRQGTALSWSACALTLFLIVEARRLWPIPWEHGTKIVPVIGWPDLFLCLLILWGRWIDEAAQKVAETNPDKIVDKILPALLARLGTGEAATQSMTAPDGSSMTQTTGAPIVAVVPDAALPAVPAVATADEYAGPPPGGG